MIKVFEDMDVCSMMYKHGVQQKVPRKRFACPHCEGEIAFYAFSPLSCPICKKGLADLEKIMGDKPYGRIAFFMGKFV